MMIRTAQSARYYRRFSSEIMLLREAVIRLLFSPRRSATAPRLTATDISLTFYDALGRRLPRLQDKRLSKSSPRRARDFDRR